MLFINTLPKNDRFRVVLLGYADPDSDDGFEIYAHMCDTEERANKINNEFILNGWSGYGIHKMSYAPSDHNKYEYMYRGFCLTMMENERAPFGIVFGVVDIRDNEPVNHGADYYNLESALIYIDKYLAGED